MLAETIFHGGGGGQPPDGGTIGGFRLRGIARGAEGELLHLLEGPVEGVVEMCLDGAVRLDHMQQHTAQHILSSVALRSFGWPTTAFHMGDSLSDIELDAGTLSLPDLEGLEKEANRVVMDDLPVSTSFAGTDALETGGVRSRLLPANLEGPLRIVEISGLDRNTCSGTHVTSTGRVQIVKIAGTERIRGGTRVFYLAGGRVARTMGEMLERERALSSALTCGPGDHVDSVRRLKESARAHASRVRDLRRELAGMMGSRLPPGALSHLHRDDEDLEFLGWVADAAPPACRLFLTAGRDEMVFLLQGPPGWALSNGPDAAALMGGRGGGKGGRYQGRASGSSAASVSKVLERLDREPADPAAGRDQRGSTGS